MFRAVISIISLISLISACGWLNKDDHDAEARASGDLEGLMFVDGIRYFKNCSEVHQKVHAILESKKQNDRAQLTYYRNRSSKYDYSEDRRASMPSSPSSFSEGASPVAQDSAGGESAKDVQTNLQEAVVDEADYIKANKNHVFSFDDAQIQVVSRGSLSYLGELPTGALNNVQMFTDEDRLIVLGSRAKRRTVCTKSDDNERRCKSINDAVTEVRVYRSSPEQMPKKLYGYEVTGTYQEARMIEGTLYLIAQDELQVEFGRVGSDPLGPEDEPIDEGREEIFVDFRKLGGGVSSNINDRPISDNGIEPALPPSSFQTTRIPNLATNLIPNSPVGLDDGGQSIWGVKCSSILKPPVDDVDFSFLKISRIDTRNESSKAQSAGTLGSGGIVYATDKAIYTTKQGLRWVPWYKTDDTSKDYYDWQVKEQLLQDQLAIFKLDVTDEKRLAFTASTVLSGRLKDRWALKELRDGAYLAAATTTGILNGRDDLEARNHLFILQQEGAQLSKASAIRDFGENEDIRAVRYIGDTAYIVTFRQTDPLFAFDLSDPKDVTLLGELKIPGFSTYLHPYSDTRMIGIGFDANGDESSGFATYSGIQVSLFDISDAENLERIDNKVHGGRGSHSEVTANSRAFYFDDQEKVFALPVVEVAGGGGLDAIVFNDWTSPVPNQRSGAVFYTVSKDKLVPLGWASHSEMIPITCRALLSSTTGWQTENRSIDVNRIFKLDGNLLSISRWGLKQHSLAENTVNVQKTVQFDGKTSSDACKNFRPIVFPAD